MSVTTLTAADRALQYKNKTSLYNEGGINRVKKHWQYACTSLRNNQENRSAALSCIVTGALSGSFIGLKVGENAEKIIRKDITKGAVGKIVGSSTGFLIGGMVGGYAYMSLSEYDTYFERWRQESINAIVKQEITNQYAYEPILKDFTCPIELCVMDLPLHTPSGVFYDSDFIIKAQRDSKGKIIDPNGNEPFPVNLAEPDYERSLVIHKRSKYLIQQDFEQVKSNPSLAIPLQEGLREIQNKIFERYERCRFSFEEARMKKQLTPVQYRQTMEEFERLFGESADSDLDWGLNWPSILNQRWVSFHPGDKVLNTNEIL